MIEYAKVILPEVFFWEDLFKKELLKCIGWTEINEMDELFTWCYNTFGEMHPDILAEAFANTACKIRNDEIPSYSFTPYKMQNKDHLIVEAA
ncbi:hypothetical protein MASR2M47_42580 [Draconibacterium sp.]|jgi:hypothetical protein